MTQGTLPHVYFRGKITPANEATVSIASNSLQYGSTCFGGIRGYHKNGSVSIFRLKDHHERLMNSSRIMGMGVYMPYEEFHKIIGDLIARNQPKTDIYIRPFLYSGEQQLIPRIDKVKFELAVYFVEMGAYFAANKGVRLGISSWQKFSDNALPTKAKAGGCYVNSALATAEAARSGYDEALLTDHDGHIVEASVANLLMVYRDRIISPPIGAPILEGITLRTMIELLEAAGKPVHFERIDRSMVYTCQELLLLGTAAQVTFVESVDGRRLGRPAELSAEATPGPVCQLLRDQFAQILAKKHPKSAEWLTEFRY